MRTQVIAGNLRFGILNRKGSKLTPKIIVLKPLNRSNKSCRDRIETLISELYQIYFKIGIYPFLLLFHCRSHMCPYTT